MTNLPVASSNNPHLTAPLHGKCVCTQISYTLNASPIKVNCCHCIDCQQKSGTAFATNLIIERSNVQVTSQAQPTTTQLSPGVDITRCGTCQTRLWNTYPSFGTEVLFVQVGTMDRCQEVRPDVHVYTKSKVDWLELPAGVKRYQGGTPKGEPDAWTEEGRRRMEVVLGRKV